MLTWSIRLAEYQSASIPVTTVHSMNRDVHGSYIDLSGSNSYFIDLGAHQGETIAGFSYFCKINGIKDKYHISSYEPSRQAQIWTPLVLAATHYETFFSSVFLGNYAVSSTTCFKNFRDDGSAGSSLHPDKPLNKSEKSTIVPTLSLTSIIAQIPMSAKHIIVKLNVEGAEYEILDSLLSDSGTLSRVNEFYLDFHGHQFKDKQHYLDQEIRFLNHFASIGITCSEIDFMRPYYYGLDKFPLIKRPISVNDRIKAYQL